MFITIPYFNWLWDASGGVNFPGKSQTGLLFKKKKAKKLQAEKCLE
jgi:hypothetical protein